MHDVVHDVRVPRDCPATNVVTLATWLFLLLWIRLETWLKVGGIGLAVVVGLLLLLRGLIVAVIVGLLRFEVYLVLLRRDITYTEILKTLHHCVNAALLIT